MQAKQQAEMQEQQLQMQQQAAAGQQQGGEEEMTPADQELIAKYGQPEGAEGQGGQPQGDGE
jgi:hypothetical protein